MPNWKKVILSGSKAALYDITASNLPAEAGSSNDILSIDGSGHFQITTRGDIEGASLPINLATNDVTGILPSAKMDEDTAHLSGTQTFTGAKTFSSEFLKIANNSKIANFSDDGSNIHFPLPGIVNHNVGNKTYIRLLESTYINSNFSTNFLDEITLNPSSLDVDTRISSDPDAYNLFVEGSNGHVGIGTSTPNTKLYVLDSVGNSNDAFVATFENLDNDLTNTGGIRIKLAHNASTSYPYQSNADSNNGLSQASAPRFIQFESSGGISGYIRPHGQNGIRVVSTSDRRYKTNIENLDTGLDAILKTRPVKFNWKNDANNPTKVKGFIAQEIKEILPEAVDYDIEEDKYYLSDIALIPTLVKAIQDQQKIIDSLESRLKKLEQS